MKRILIILGLISGLYGVACAGDVLSCWASTATVTLISGSARIDEFCVESTTNTTQLVIFYDNSVEKWRMIVPPYSATNGTGGRDVHLSTFIKFYTDCSVVCTDTYGNNKVKVQVVKQ